MDACPTMCSLPTSPPAMPAVPTRYAGSQSSAVAFGWGYYYQQPSVAIVDAATQATVDQ